MILNTHIHATLTPEFRLEQVLKGKDIATVAKLSIAGTIAGDDFLFIRENMAETLQELDISNASVKKNGIEFFKLSTYSESKSISIPDSIVEIKY
jgi:hypothetical protein